jgi:quercetin dioxygenase-like cupin family protein
MHASTHHHVVTGPLEGGPWVAEGPGKWSRLLHVLPGDAGWVELMRLDPGTPIAPHRHTGEVHATNLRGHRRLCTGELVGPGDYVHEPAGNADSWQAVGDEALIVLVVVLGAVEYLGPQGQVVRRITAADVRAQAPRA